MEFVQTEKFVKSRINDTVRNYLRERKFQREQKTEDTSHINDENCGDAKMPDKTDISLQEGEDAEKKTAPEYRHQKRKKAHFVISPWFFVGFSQCKRAEKIKLFSATILLAKLY